MGLTPKVKVSGPGADIINRRLVSFQRTDVSGVQSDQLRLVVDMSGESGRPRQGAVIQFSEGYDDDLFDKGQFSISRVIPRLFPPSLTIIATAAPFTPEDATGFKERRTRTFSDTTLGNVFRQCVQAHGFSPRVASQLDAIPIAHLDQTNETDAAFLTRVAREHDAIAKPVGNLYVLAARGEVRTLTGREIPPVRVSLPYNNSPDAHHFINCQLEEPGRTSVEGIKAAYTDVQSGQEVMVAVGNAPFKKLRQTFDSQSSAQQACTAELVRVRRQGATLRMELPGDPSLVAEGLLVLDDSFPPEIAGQWSIDKVVASGQHGGGYRCHVTATQPRG
ncbi:contractile injection system protein, VgrG/Pvc8 family [Pseudoalteromonas rubra]|uniref:contractile injection system protein, VgrG/Pvc8 family n=1 Tax=Pseudoalteromonas rubra TaxID=43658 RepID=UPI000F7AFD22|nr:contractile injection system protein, VgrG/Pvc8 family [Pseudoalteromonas rubra]